MVTENEQQTVDTATEPQAEVQIEDNTQETVIVGNKRGLSGISTEQHPILQGMGQTRVYV